MDLKKRGELEQSIHASLQRGDLKQVTALGVSGYGPEIKKWLGMTLRDPAAVEEVFSMFSENMWKGISTFRGDCQFRTWLYCVARNTLATYLRTLHARREELYSSMTAQGGAQDTRSATQPWLRTDIKDAFAQLRERLPPEDQELLFLRINQRMPWEEIVYILAGQDTPLTKDELRKRSCVLRKRFQRVKESLHQMAQEEGLLSWLRS